MGDALAAATALARRECSQRSRLVFIAKQPLDAPRRVG
jgi:hypothetical protein